MPGVVRIDLQVKGAGVPCSSGTVFRGRDVSGAIDGCRDRSEGADSTVIVFLAGCIARCDCDQERGLVSSKGPKPAWISHDCRVTVTSFLMQPATGRVSPVSGGVIETV
jgi:hypothetical protein